MKIIVRHGFFCALILGCLAVVSGDASAGNSNNSEAKPLPEISLPALVEGGAVIGREAMAGKVVYLDFWASWCSPCRSSFPWMEAMNQKYKSKGLLIIGVNKDQEIADAKRFVTQHPVNFALARDPQDSLIKNLGVIVMPTAFLIDRKGMIRAAHTGFRSGDQEALEKEINILLEQP